jgi:hypothetical protein
MSGAPLSLTDSGRKPSSPPIPDDEDLELVEELEFIEEEDCPVKYVKLEPSDESASDEDETLEIVIRKLRAHTTGPTPCPCPPNTQTRRKGARL